MAVNITDVFLQQAPSANDVTLNLSASVNLTGASLLTTADTAAAMIAEAGATLANGSTTVATNAITCNTTVPMTGKSVSGSIGTSSPFGDGIARIDTR
jgi:hypothetical protein